MTDQRSYSSALSELADPMEAATEVAAEVLAGVGPSPDLAVLFVTLPHLDALTGIADNVRSLLRPGALLAAAAVAVVGDRREVEQSPGITLFAARLGSAAEPVRLRAARTDGGWALDGLPAESAAAARSMLLVADPFSFPVDALLDRLRTDRADVAVIGGLASAASRPGDNRLVLDGSCYTDGAVGVLLADDVSPQTVVSQGCRPIGRPYVVTRADRHVLYELGGQPALHRLVTTLERLTPSDRTLAERGLHCGVVIDETKVDFERGDFLIRGVLGADPDTGGVAVGDVVEVGSTVQFQVRDAASADEDLRALLAGRSGRGALVFTCNGRGQHLFGLPDHDATVVSEVLDTSNVAGMFCAGELGPVSGRNAVHGFTASVAIFS